MHYFILSMTVESTLRFSALLCAYDQSTNDDFVDQKKCLSGHSWGFHHDNYTSTYLKSVNIAQWNTIRISAIRNKFRRKRNLVGLCRNEILKKVIFFIKLYLQQGMLLHLSHIECHLKVFMNIRNSYDCAFGFFIKIMSKVLATMCYVSLWRRMWIAWKQLFIVR